MKLVGQVGGRIEAVAVQGDYAYVAVGLRLVVLDVSDPSKPREIGSTTPFPQFVEGVAVSGTLAYVAASVAGLRIVDISDPAHPLEIGAYDTPGYAEGVAIAGQYAYVADGPYGLRIVEVSDPTRPVERAYAYPLNYAFDAAVDGRYAYLAAAGAGLLVVDVSDPASPVELGTLDTTGYAYGVDVAEDMVYIADGWEGLRVVNISDPAHPVEIGSHKTPGWAFGVDVADGIAYVADAFGGFRVLDVSAPAHLAELGGYAVSGGHAGSVAVAGGIAYVADRNWGLHLLDVSDPGAPAQVGFYSPLGHDAAVAVSGGYAYVAAATNGLRVVDVSNPAHPVEVGAYDTQGNAIDVTVEGSYAYVAVMCPGAGQGLHVVDVSNPAQPIKVGYRPQIEGCYRDIVVADGIAYVANEWGLELIDVSSPHAPTLVGYIKLMGEEWNATTGVDVSGTLAYVAQDGEGLRIVDVCDPSGPTLISAFKDSQWVKGFRVAIAGSRAYVTHHGGDGLKIVDVSDPVHPTLIGAYQGPSLPERVTVVGNTAYVAFGSGGLHAIDVTDPSSPTLVFSYDTPGYAMASGVDGNYVYLADAEGGLLIFQVGEGSPVPARPTGARLAPAVTTPGVAATSQPYVADLSAEVAEGRAVVVTSTADTGPGTLRQALEEARSGYTITFDPAAFPPESPATIALQTNLPPIWQGNLTIDASEAGVILDGSDVDGGIGLTLTSDRNVIRGLQILRFPNSGIVIGIFEMGANNNIIGGDRTTGSGPMGQGNLISGNGSGIEIVENSYDNTVAGNFIGTDLTGRHAFANQVDGVMISNSHNNTVGGTLPGERNIVSANGWAGVHLIGGATGNVVVNNYIGTDVSGKADLGNKWTGMLLELSSPQNVIKNNLISGNDWGGVSIGDWGSSYNTVVGNLIGTDVSGTQTLGNGLQGVGVGENFNRIGGASMGEGNVISGNPVGVELHGTGNLVQGNFIGTDISGTKAIGNSAHGIFGVDGSNNFVGGTTPGERNIISGNGASGISLGGTERSFIMGNYIGTDVTGTLALPNQAGVAVEGVQNFIQRNLIAYNGKCGVMVNSGEGNTLVHNDLIGNVCNGYDSGQGTRWSLDGQGNYWSDYKGTDANGDGIGDTPHPVPPNGADRYPLMKPPEEVVR